MNAIEQNSHSKIKYRVWFCFPDTKNHFNTLEKTFYPQYVPGKMWRQKHHLPGLKQPGLHTSSGSGTNKASPVEQYFSFLFSSIC